MTTMESDSESQDSDDGRRFRFEATRKDNVQLEAKLEKLSRLKSEREYIYNDTEAEDKRDRTKISRVSKERDNDDRDLKHSAKYLKHSPESRGSRREESKDHRSTKDISSYSRSSPLYSKHKIRDVKRHKTRDRDEHRCGRSQEACRSKNENDKSQNEKHRNKPYERHKHHTSEKSRSRSYQSTKTRSADLGKVPHDASETCSTYKKSLMKHDEEEREEECTSPKNVEQSQRSAEFLIKGEVAAESQDSKELNLSEFDVLSETDGNMSDESDVKNESSWLRPRNQKTEKRSLESEYQNSSKKQAIELEPSGGSPKVNARKSDESHGSSNNTSGTISDSTLGTTSPMLTESRNNTIDSNSEGENFDTADNASLHLHNHDSVNVSLSEVLDDRSATYGPVLPPQLTINSPKTTEKKDVHFIGPCLPRNYVQSGDERTTEDTLCSSTDNNAEPSKFDLDDIAFGPALPPHLLKEKFNDGSTIPDTAECGEFDDEDGIGPLPVNHPALENSNVYRQLEKRARQIKNEQSSEITSVLNQREEWMTELPPAEMSNIGLTSRKFRVKDGPDMSDRSCWTDTPAKKAEKEKQKKEVKLYNVAAPIPRMSEDKDESESLESKKRGKSLLEVHQNKLRKKKKKEEKKAKAAGQTTRRPFDRDIDLQISRFNQAQKNSVINRAQQLDERFSRGKY